MGPRVADGDEPVAEDAAVIDVASTGRQSNLLIRSTAPISPPGWEVLEPSFEEIVLAYLRNDARSRAAGDDLDDDWKVEVKAR